MTDCVSCKKVLKPEFPHTFDGEEEQYQFDNALWIGLFGGYGMFVESSEMVENSNSKILREFGATYEFVLCHDCTHKLMEENKWMKDIVKPHYSHAHTLDYWSENPDHEGWDSPKSNN